jgi:hypothetical protein
MLHGNPEAIVLFNNIASIPATTFQCPADEDEKAALVLEIDLAMREQAPAGWKGDEHEEAGVNAYSHHVAGSHRDRRSLNCQTSRRLLMTETIHIGDLSIQVKKKDIKNVHLSVHPPDGRVTLVAPTATRLEVARAYAISKLSWIREQQRKLKNQARETPRQFIERESHYLWGRRYLMTVLHRDAKPTVR